LEVDNAYCHGGPVRRRAHGKPGDAERAGDDFQAEPGYVSLFNGKDLTGWKYYKETDLNGQKPKPPTNVFASSTASSSPRKARDQGSLHD